MTEQKTCAICGHATNESVPDWYFCKKYALCPHKPTEQQAPVTERAPVYPINLQDDNAISCYMYRYVAIDMGKTGYPVILVGSMDAKETLLSAVLSGVPSSEVMLVQIDDLATDPSWIDFLCQYPVFAAQYDLVCTIWQVITR